MTSIVNSDPSLCKPLWRMGIIDQLVGLAYRNVDASFRNANGNASGATFLTEHVFSALCFFANSNADCLEECRRSDLPLRSTLKKRLVQIKDDDQFEEERNYAKKLFKLIEGPNADGPDDAEGSQTER